MPFSAEEAMFVWSISSRPRQYKRQGARAQDSVKGVDTAPAQFMFIAATIFIIERTADVDIRTTQCDGIAHKRELLHFVRTCGSSHLCASPIAQRNAMRL
jgi:hypothetical protein